MSHPYSLNTRSRDSEKEGLRGNDKRNETPRLRAPFAASPFLAGDKKGSRASRAPSAPFTPSLHANPKRPVGNTPSTSIGPPKRRLQQPAANPFTGAIDRNGAALQSSRRPSEPAHGVPSDASRLPARPGIRGEAVDVDGVSHASPYYDPEPPQRAGDPLEHKPDRKSEQRCQLIANPRESPGNPPQRASSFHSARGGTTHDPPRRDLSVERGSNPAAFRRASNPASQEQKRRIRVGTEGAVEHPGIPTRQPQHDTKSAGSPFKARRPDQASNTAKRKDGTRSASVKLPRKNIPKPVLRSVPVQLTRHDANPPRTIYHDSAGHPVRGYVPPLKDRDRQGTKRVNGDMNGSEAVQLAEKLSQRVRTSDSRRTDEVTRHSSDDGTIRAQEKGEVVQLDIVAGPIDVDNADEASHRAPETREEPFSLSVRSQERPVTEKRVVQDTDMREGFEEHRLLQLDEARSPHAGSEVLLEMETTEHLAAQVGPKNHRSVSVSLDEKSNVDACDIICDAETLSLILSEAFQHHQSVLMLPSFGATDENLEDVLSEDFPIRDKLERKLILSENRFTRFTAKLCESLKSWNVVSFDLSRNRLRIFDNAISVCTQLRVLNLSRNKLSSVPRGVSDLTNLEMLDLSRNSIATLPPKLFKLKKLEILDLSRNQIDRLPTDWVGEDSVLSSLSVSGNTSLERFPGCSRHLVKLVDFDFGDTRFKNLLRGSDLKLSPPELLALVAGLKTEEMVERKTKRASRSKAKEQPAIQNVE